MHPRKAYFWFLILFNLGMSVTFVSYVPFLISLGLTPSDVSMVNVWFWAAIMACELPTGLFADRVSRVQSVRCGSILSTLGALLYWTASGFVTALLYEVILGVGAAFVSGAGYVGILGAVGYSTKGLTWDNALIGRIWTIAGVLLTLIAMLLWLKRPPPLHRNNNSS